MGRDSQTTVQSRYCIPFSRRYEWSCLPNGHKLHSPCRPTCLPIQLPNAHQQCLSTKPDCIYEHGIRGNVLRDGEATYFAHKDYTSTIDILPRRSRDPLLPKMYRESTRVSEAESARGKSIPHVCNLSSTKLRHVTVPRI